MATLRELMSLILLLTQQMCVYLVIVYLVSKTPLFKLFAESSKRLPHKFFIYVVFSLFCIMATYFGEQTTGAIANTRAMGAVLGGLLGGPVTGFLSASPVGCTVILWADLPISRVLFQPP